jgi:hypothetical protein
MEQAGHHGLTGGDPVAAASRDIVGPASGARAGRSRESPSRTTVQPEALEDEADGALNLLVSIESKALGSGSRS